MSPITGHRESWWEWYVLDRVTGARKYPLSGVVPGSSQLDLNVNAGTRMSGTLKWTGPPEQMPDWDSVHLQPVYRAREAGGAQEDLWPLGVFLPTTPGLSYQDSSSVSTTISIYDRTLILREDQIPVDLAYPVGTNPVAAVREQVLAATGPDAIPPAITETTETLRTAMFWPSGTSRLRIINDLLQTIDYFALWADYRGRYRSSPYVSPLRRPLEYVFESGARSIHRSDYTINRDMFKVPNQLIAISQSDGDTPGMLSVATNENPASRYSYQRRGRWISNTIEGVEATSQEVLDSIAQRRLEEASRVRATVEITHAPVLLEGHDLVELARPGVHDSLTGTVQSITMKDDGLWTTVLREAGEEREPDEPVE